jgi:hypothetical protein
MVNASLRCLNPNPGGLVAKMTSKTQNCCDKFIIHKKIENFLIFHKHLVFNFVYASFPKMKSFLIILSKCSDLCLFWGSVQMYTGRHVVY